MEQGRLRLNSLFARGFAYNRGNCALGAARPSNINLQGICLLQIATKVAENETQLELPLRLAGDLGNKAQTLLKLKAYFNRSQSYHQYLKKGGR